MTDDPRIKIRQLEVFDAVMRTGRLTAAAAHLDISQPAVSASIRRLETHLDTTLFEREGRRLKPTENAVNLAQAIRPVFSAMSELTDEIARAGLRDAAQLRIAVTPSVGHGIAMAALKRLSRRGYDVKVDFTTASDDWILNAVELEQVDLGIVLGAIRETSLRRIALPQTHLVAFLPRDHALTKHATLGPADLAGEPVIDAGQMIAPLVAGAFARQGVVYSPSYETHQSHTACAMVKARLGVSVVDVFAAELYTSGDCVIRRFYPPTPLMTTVLRTLREAGSKEHILAAYTDALQDAIGTLPFQAHQYRSSIYNQE